MKLDTGLFQPDFADHHAVLGIPLTADAKVVRKRYLAIARRLHPDSLSGLSDEDAQQASDLLSKWVNPAYEALSQEKISAEHQIILKLKGQGLKQAATPPEVSSEAARTLLQAAQVEMAYQQAVTSLADTQYEELAQVLAVIGQLSELNLVYLYRTSGSPAANARAATPPASAPAPESATAPEAAATGGSSSPPPQRRAQATILESYFNRAQEFETNRDYGRAVLEMREALKTYPNSARCHSYLASLYLKAGQATMAKIHAKRALDLLPEDEVAQAVQAKLEKGAGGAANGTAGKSAAKSSARGGTSSTKGKAGDKGGGFFGGLFGGKKK